MEIMLITPHTNKEKEIDIIIQLFENGLSTLHLNKPEMSTRRMKEYISSIPENFHNKIIIHSHHILAFKFSLKGIHFTKHHLNRTFKNWCLFQKEKLFRKKLIHTRSYHRLSDAFNQEKYHFDYYLLRSVFNRITNDFNTGYHPIRINELHKTNKKFVVRGGINFTTALKAKQFNFYGICLYSYIWNSPDPIKNFLELKETLNE
jgi:thiamine-phosphate pyrophosphorylase